MLDVVEFRGESLDDDVCGRRSLLGGILSICPPTILDVAGENLPIDGYFVSVFSVVSSLKAWLSFLVPQFSFRLDCMVSRGWSSCFFLLSLFLLVELF